MTSSNSRPFDMRTEATIMPLEKAELWGNEVHFK